MQGSGATRCKTWDRPKISLLCRAFILWVAFGGTAWAQSATQHGIALTWVAPTTDANGNALPAGTVLTYDVWRATASAGPFTQINSSPVSGTSYLDPASGLAANTTYFYEVTAIDAGGQGAPSAQASVSVTTFPVNPGAPSGCSGKVQ